MSHTIRRDRSTTKATAHLTGVGPPSSLRLAEEVQRSSPAALSFAHVPHARKPVPNRQRLRARHSALQAQSGGEQSEGPTGLRVQRAPLR